MKKKRIYDGFLGSQSEFSHRFASWARNHRGWSKAKHANKRLAKRRERNMWKKDAASENERIGCEYCTGDIDDRPFLDGMDLYIDNSGKLVSCNYDCEVAELSYCPKCGRPLL